MANNEWCLDSISSSSSSSIGEYNSDDDDDDLSNSEVQSKLHKTPLDSFGALEDALPRRGLSRSKAFWNLSDAYACSMEQIREDPYSKRRKRERLIAARIMFEKNRNEGITAKTLITNSKQNKFSLVAAMCTTSNLPLVVVTVSSMPEQNSASPTRPDSQCTTIDDMANNTTSTSPSGDIDQQREELN